MMQAGLCQREDMAGLPPPSVAIAQSVCVTWCDAHRIAPGDRNASFPTAGGHLSFWLNLKNFQIRFAARFTSSLATVCVCGSFRPQQIYCLSAASCQRVRVETEVEAYPTESVDLRCEFVDGGNTKLTQVSWIWEPTEGQRDNIAVFHPTYGESFPESPFSGRVRFIQGNLTSPSITITSLKMADAGRYTCEYATYPSGNEQGTTNLVMLAKPKNSASPVVVQASTSGKPVVVAQCEAADSKPAATIKWMGAVGGTENTTSKNGPDGTVTVRSEYLVVPTPEDNGKEVTCIISQRTQDKPQTFPMKLAVEYPPNVSIVGYDNNWYIGRTDAVLTCQATGNPAPTTVTWTVMSGPMPDTVQINANKLIVRKVDEAVNTTFVCEVKNRLGVSKHQVTTAVIDLSSFSN
uniref:Nectin cell adhesion molecule 3 n=1 Tax=Hucho hucho TaxID=62062 RepID=A0A4W5KRR7_9TELE